MRPLIQFRLAVLWPLVLLTSCAPPPEGGGVCALSIGEAVHNEGWIHVDEGSPLTHEHNPPASGPHYPSWAEYKTYDEPLPRGNWIHNLEHGAIVFLHRPGAPERSIELLEQAFEGLSVDPACGHKRALLTPDPDLDSAVAVVAADAVLEGEELSIGDMIAFAEACRGHAPEHVCASGGSVGGG